VAGVVKHSLRWTGLEINPPNASCHIKATWNLLPWMRQNVGKHLISVADTRFDQCLAEQQREGKEHRHGKKI
jgi:hypothetical protein